jgi:hypothetical protein
MSAADLLHVLRLDFATTSDADWRAAESQLRRLREVAAVTALAVHRDRFADRVLGVFVRLQDRELIAYQEDPVHREVAAWLRTAGVSANKLDVPAEALAHLLSTKEAVHD